MGLLDDAIREHLELKRRHGADPEEVARQEREALGAARRGEFVSTEAGEPVAAEESPAVGDEPMAEAEEAVEGGEREAEGGEPAAGAAEPPESGAQRQPFDVEARDELPPQAPAAPGPGREAGAPGYDEDPWQQEERDEVPAEESLDRRDPAGEQPGEDVLEETPDFLQETPEHDRLWFEQRPPRDFDWDK
jgi:hypothetical protein